jgi:hypothetical protein
MCRVQVRPLDGALSSRPSSLTPTHPLQHPHPFQHPPTHLLEDGQHIFEQALVDLLPLALRLHELEHRILGLPLNLNVHMVCGGRAGQGGAWGVEVL